MAAGGAVKELSEIITCEICLEVMEGRKPRALRCLHAFCEECLQHLLDDTKFKNPSNSGKIFCPVCTQTTQVPGGSAANLPIFFHASKVQDVRAGIEKRHITCRMCKSETHKADISSYCFSCTCGHCEDCRVKHDSVYLNHSQISLSPSTLSTFICSQHDVHMTHFCMTCAKAVCSQCRVHQHFEHKVYDVSYDGKNIQRELKDFLLSNLKSTKEKIQNLLKLEAKVDEDMKKAINEMTYHRDYLVKQVNDQYKSMCEELNKKQDDFKHDLTRYKELAQDAALCIEKLLKQTESWHEPVTGVPESRILNCEKLIADVKEQVPSVDLDMKQQTIKFVSGDDYIELGKIAEEDVGVSPTLLYEIEREDDITDIDYLDNGHLVVCMTKGVSVYNGQILLSNHYIAVNCRPSDSYGNLWSVCVCKKAGKVAVLENRYRGRPGYLHVYRPDGDRWQYNRYDICGWPWRVSITSCGHFVVYSGVFDANTKSFVSRILYQYNSRGVELWHVDVSHDGDVWDVSVSDNDMIFACHPDKVVVYNTEGKKMSTLSTTDRQLEPRGVCMNKNGEIFVSDIKSQDVLLFNNKHCFVRSLIHLDFVPYKMCLYKNVILSVCGWLKSKNLWVYKI